MQPTSGQEALDLGLLGTTDVMLSQQVPKRSKEDSVTLWTPQDDTHPTPEVYYLAPLKPHMIISETLRW